MFCPECGAKNADDAVFCENCGADISQALKEADDELKKQPEGGVRPAQMKDTAVPPAAPDFTYTPAQTRAKKPVKTSTKVVTAAVLAVLVAGIALFETAKSMTSPQKIAMDYVGAIKDRNWATVYSYLDISGNGFLTEKNFENIQKKTNPLQIANYSVLSEKDENGVSAKGNGSEKKTTPASAGLVKEVTIQYTAHGSASPMTEEVTLVKQPEKKWLFFDVWKVSSEGYITPEADVTVPSGMTVYLNDVKLDDKYKAQAGDGSADSQDSNGSVQNGSSSSQNSDGSGQNGTEQVKYAVKNIFSGPYTIKVVSPNTEDFQKPVDINTGANSFTFDQFTLKKEVLDSVTKQPEEIIQALYASALAGKDYDSVSSYFAPDAGSGNNNFKDEYEQLKNLIANGTNPGFQKISFSNFDSQAEANGMEINVTTKFDYSYTAVNATYDPAYPAQPFDGNNSAQVQTGFRLVNGKWLVGSMDNIELSYNNNSYGY